MDIKDSPPPETRGKEQQSRRKGEEVGATAAPGTDAERGSARIPEQVRGPPPPQGLTADPLSGAREHSSPWADQPERGQVSAQVRQPPGGSRKLANHLHPPGAPHGPQAPWAEGDPHSWMGQKATDYERLDGDRSSVNESVHGATAGGDSQMQALVPRGVGRCRRAPITLT